MPPLLPLRLTLELALRVLVPSLGLLDRHQTSPEGYQTRPRQPRGAVLDRVPLAVVFPPGTLPQLLVMAVLPGRDFPPLTPLAEQVPWEQMVHRGLSETRLADMGLVAGPHRSPQMPLPVGRGDSLEVVVLAVGLRWIVWEIVVLAATAVPDIS